MLFAGDFLFAVYGVLNALDRRPNVSVCAFLNEALIDVRTGTAVDVFARGKRSRCCVLETFPESMSNQITTAFVEQSITPPPEAKPMLPSKLAGAEPALLSSPDVIRDSFERSRIQHVIQIAR